MKFRQSVIQQELTTEILPALLPEKTGVPSGDGGTGGTRHEARWLILIVLFISVVYIGVATYLNQFGTFWSPDCDVRFTMLRSWASGGSPIFLNFPGHELDPTNAINPIGELFAITVPKGLCGVYNPVFVVLCGVFYRLFGFGGLTVIPLAAGIITVLITYASARLLGLRSRLLMTLLLGIGTPLLIYSTIFWDHSLQMMLSALATYFVLRLLREHRPVLGFTAGAVLGFGVWIHPLQGVLFAAMGAALLLVQRKNLLRVVPASLLGFVPFVAAFALWNLTTYGSFGGAHAVGTLRNTQATQQALPISAQLLERSKLEFLGLQDQSHSLALLLVCVYIACYLLSLFAGERVRRWAAPLLCFGAAEILWRTIGEVGWVDGLFQGTPLLIPALAAPFLRTQGKYQNPDSNLLWQRWMAITFLLFSVGVFLSPGFIGLNWGSRFLLTCLPLLVLLAAYTLETHLSESQGISRLVVYLVCGSLVFASLFSEVRGLECVVRSMRDWQELSAVTESSSSPVFVTDSWQLSIQTLKAKQPEFRFLVTGKPEEQAVFLHFLQQTGIHEFTFIGSDKGALQMDKLCRTQPKPSFLPARVSRVFRFVQVRFVQKQ